MSFLSSSSSNMDCQETKNIIRQTDEQTVFQWSVFTKFCNFAGRNAIHWWGTARFRSPGQINQFWLSDTRTAHWDQPQLQFGLVGGARLASLPK